VVRSKELVKKRGQKKGGGGGEKKKGGGAPDKLTSSLFFSFCWRALGRGDERKKKGKKGKSYSKPLSYHFSID